MVIETELLSLGEWLSGAWQTWLWAVGLLFFAALLVAYLTTAARVGPIQAVGRIARGVWGGLLDICFLSPRRVLALTRLAIQESLHRLVLVAFIVFIVVLLFAGWFLDPGSYNPTQLYLSFVLTATTYLVLLLALFLSVFSLPTDITRRTIYTIVTKPVRSSEIILGRVLGFGAVGTIMLAGTGVVSYFFVVRGLSHTHTVVAADLRADDSPGAAEGALVGQTEFAQGHRHQVFVDADGFGRTDTVRGHYHTVAPVDEGTSRRYELSAPQGLFTARVPHYGKLHFKDRSGEPTARGINVGNEWTYRSYIDGATLAAAIWRFDNLQPVQFGDNLPLELNIRVFRTTKGDMERGVLGSLVLRNPESGLASRPINFVAKEYQTDLHRIPRTLIAAGTEGREIDLFDDLLANGSIEVELSCLQREHYFGVAQADVYLRADDASFTTNFIKGYIGIWLQMWLVTACGVVFSTFLNGAVAMLLTLVTMLGGFFTEFMRQLAQGQILGGGPLESLYRMVNQTNVVVEIEPGAGRTFMEMIDGVFKFGLGILVKLVPDFNRLSDVDYVVYGYSIPADEVLIHILLTASYLVPILLLGHFIFRSREVAK